MRQITYERDPDVSVGVPVWSPDGTPYCLRLVTGQQGIDLRRVAGGPGRQQPSQPRQSGSWPGLVARRPLGLLRTRGGAAADAIVLRKVPAAGGSPVTVRTEKVRNVIGSDGATLYYVFAHPLVDGTPEFEIRAARPEDAAVSRARAHSRRRGCQSGRS